MRKRALFVVPEASAGASLQALWAPLSDEWELEVVATAAEALSCLGASPVDVIVSDMHLIGMGGRQLLAEVRRRAPRVIRIASSACAHRGLILSALEVAHQFIPAPFTAEVVRAMLVRTGSSEAPLMEESLRTVIAGIRTLPSLPQLYQELVVSMEAPTASAADATRIISQDMAMVTKLLQVVNSAFFGLRRTIASPAHAVALLGIDTVKSLVLSVQVFAQFDGRVDMPIPLESLWRHSLAVGRSARDIAKSRDIGSIGVEGAFMAGLLHDVGQLVLVANFPGQYGEVLEYARNQRVPVCAAEKALFNSTHQDVGAYLLGLWGLSDAIVEAVAYHHDPEAHLREGGSPLAAVHEADALEEAADAMAL